MTDPTPAAAAGTSGTLSFAEFNEPALESGNYTVSVSQTVSCTAAQGNGTAFSEAFTASLAFTVAGARFTLPNGAVAAQYPAAGASGDFAAVLPHVVLADPTLPWQRSSGYAGAPAGGTPYLGQGGVDPKRYPWLALLCFDSADPIPTIVSGTVADLQTPPSGTLSYPGLATLEAGEAATDSCNWTDVPAALFSDIAPSAEDMRWLAHVRTVDTGQAKAGGATGGDATLSYATLVGNRLPNPGGTVTCMLVSLENLSGYLPNSGSGLPAGTKAVRLAVLGSWSFACTTATETFGQWFQNLNRSPATLQIPYATTGTGSLAAVQSALAMGYTAIDHQTRQGAATVSWYRGPLLPFATPPQAVVPAACADGLTRYDPATGLFDVSLSTAWQLGQFLALNNQSFATTLYAWAQQQTATAVAAFEVAALTGTAPAAAGGGGQQQGQPQNQPAALQVFTGTIAPALTSFFSQGT